MSRNTPIEPQIIWCVNLETPYGSSHGFYVSEEEAKAYNADPDGWAVTKLKTGTKQVYYDWLDNLGGARCCGFTKRGKHCQAVIKCCYDPEEFAQLHRKQYCFSHSQETQETKKTTRLKLVKS